jgi:hypothetical protein
MMKDMMEGMMGGKGGMAMMDQCLQKMGDRMTGAIKETLTGASYATPELTALFEEWVKEVELEVIAFLKEKGTASAAEIAGKMTISEDSVLYLVGKMARERKIKLVTISL